MTATLKAQRDAVWASMSDLMADIKKNGASAAKRAEYDAREAILNGLDSKISGKALDTRGIGAHGRTAADEAFTRYLRSGVISAEMEQRTTGFSEGTQPGQIGGTGGNQGGYAVAQDFWANLQVAMKLYGGVANDFRQVETDTGAIAPWPTIDPTAVTAALVAAENTQLTPSNVYVFGQGVLNAWTYATSPVLVSLQLANDFAFDIDSFIAARFGEALGRSIAAAAVSGTGSSQPLGIITALNAQGAVTVGSGNSGGFYALTAATSVKNFGGTTTELASNTLSPQTVLNMVSCVDAAYWGEGAAWYMNATQALNQRGVVDANGRPLLNLDNAYEDGVIGTMAGFPVKIDNSLPNLSASTTGGPVFGSLSHAMVRRQVKGGASVMRLDQRFADYLAIGYVGYTRVDIRSNDMRAAVTCKPAAT